MPVQPYTKEQQAGGSRIERKKQQRAQEAEQMRQTYRYVDRREGMRCRTTRVRVDPQAIASTAKGHHHHVTYRSQGGQHTPDNVILVSAWVHEQIHLGKLRVTGDAEQRDEMGRLNGLTVERLTESGWQVWKTC